ncbi:MAG: flagellar motor switch protein FliM [Hyphomicrobiales bacterium]|jgi:flagellar motor switch protein FliM|nr:flagellar motor switch protein FliM [Hyphomicrobiales bacterium]
MAGNARNLIAGAREKKFSIDKLPMLAKLVDDVAILTLDAFRTRLSTPLQIRRLALSVDREEALLAQLGPSALAAVLPDAEWECNFAAMFQADFVFTLVEAMLGSDGGDAAFAEARAFSSIERLLAKCFLDALLLGLNRGFTPLQPLELTFEKFDSRLDFVTLGGRGEDAVAVRYRIEALGRGGEMTLLIPQRAINRIAAQLADSSPAALRRPDPQWARDFEERVTGAEIGVSAFAEVFGFRLGDIAGFRQGQLLTLPAHALHEVTLTAEGRRLFMCELGQSEGRYSLRIAGEHDPNAAPQNRGHALGY